MTREGQETSTEEMHACATDQLPHNVLEHYRRYVLDKIAGGEVNDRDLQTQVGTLIARMDEGSFNQCISCEGEIGVVRLDAFMRTGDLFPVICCACQGRRERAGQSAPIVRGVANGRHRRSGDREYQAGKMQRKPIR